MTDIQNLPVLPLSDSVVLPGMVIPIELDESESRAAVDAAQTADDKLLLVPRPDGEYAPVGTIATLVQVGRLPSGEPAAVVRAETRATIGSGVIGPGAALWVEAHAIDEVNADTARATELVAEYRPLVTSILQQRNAWQVIDSIQKLSDPGQLADTAGWAPYLDQEQKLILLAEPDVEVRLEKLIEWTKKHVAEQEVADQIATDVRDGMEKTQREFLLRQQLAAIRKELGEDEPDGADDYRTRVEQAELPDDVRKAALTEVGKLERTSEQSPESGWIRTWLDTVLELPWSERTEDSDDLTHTREILDTDHAGLDDVKQRLVEFLAVRQRRNRRGLSVIGGRGSGAVLSLVGPPGVGKTSIGESVARALGRKFVRVALGGVRDEAEIRGHRRTYVGAMPGRIVRAITEAGSMNPVILLDEIDKVGSDFRGDPASALLEVLDPSQNHTFRDHYLEVDLDLSDVLFLATANVIDTIPQPLLDRMEVVALDGYTEDEKVAIARDHLVPEQIAKAGLEDTDVVLSDEALGLIASEYTMEAGVRQLQRAIAKVLRKVTVELDSVDRKAADHDQDESAHNDDAPDSDHQTVRVTPDNLKDYLGRPRFTPESAERTSVPGVATGLAVTGAGGDVLFIEATEMEGEPGLVLTGQLGDVMKESVQIALSYLRSRDQAGKLADHRIHVHVPAGAVPKDGPSAGVTMVTALASLASGRPVKSSVGMTGEVTLQGKVLPIGGVKQKLLAAHRAGLTGVIIPKRNEPDLDDLPESVRDSLNIHPVADVADVLALALEDAEPAASTLAA
ncbi:endopeptidase La [Microlunatus soli]|uniref:Lon protease n=1 Tax=Microlunatus soli TaxID=630515 RepID=A0A1H1NTZ0_9ACTN|nr:endopeptidase La [Microlunatus soli]SDS02446.1 ATP-dependent Lon protease [Microlunatus soli]